mmetsp:Transcript_38316/g.33863  ORF Transcript_38316/g.33863 Transcript_38316/m.33863 type:complete len:172 (+) Transcript_38316:35-550(+)
MSSLIRRVVSRQLIHIQKSLSLQTSTQAVLISKREFTEDSKDSTSASTTVIEKEKDTLQPQDALEQVEQFEMPPIRPTYQTKTPMELIAEVPIIEVDATFVKCDGLWFESDMSPRRKDIVRHPQEGHPMQWISLNTRKPYTPQTCKYCGLRFVMKKPDDYVDPWEEYNANN